MYPAVILRSRETERLHEVFLVDDVGHHRVLVTIVLYIEHPHLPLPL